MSAPSEGSIPADLRSLLARCARFLTDATKSTDWEYFCAMFGFEELAREEPRLLQSQHFGDDDYPSCVRSLFLTIAAEQPDKVQHFVKFVLTKEVDLERKERIRLDPDLVEWLKSGGAAPDHLPIPVIGGASALNLTVFPDDFYRDLTRDINRAFSYGVLSAVQILSRKLLENLLIDILRARFGTSQLPLYFDPNKRRFQGFELLLKNVADRLGDFQGTPGLDTNLLRTINGFRELGNSSAHSLELNLNAATIRTELAELEHVAKVLIRVLQSLRTPASP